MIYIKNELNIFNFGYLFFFIYCMLYNFFLTFKFHRFCQSGGYVDFFLKKISEVFLRNIFIYLAQFFAEKYMIEVLTKKIIDNSIFFFNRYFG